jgi:cell division protein FtsN
MSDYQEKRMVVEEIPIRRARPVLQTQFDSVTRDERGMSGGAVAALVVAAIAAAIVITMLIMNNQQTKADELAQERARAANAQQAPSQPQPVIVLPQSQPSVAPPAPVPSQPAPAATPTPPTSTELEVDVSAKLLDDQDLRSSSIEVKVSGSTAMLGGQVPSEDLKTRAERLAKTVKGIRAVINNIVVKPE